MPKENNKMQVDIDTLKKQNVNDLLSIKELYKRIEELGEKITQIKYIDNTLVKKIKKEYDNLKKIIMDENIQVKLTNDIETINSHLDTKANKYDIETINSQMKQIENKQYLNFLDFGVPNDKNIDNTPYLKNALNELNKTGGTLIIPEGEWYFKTPLNYDKWLFGSKICGTGRGVLNIETSTQISKGLFGTRLTYEGDGTFLTFNGKMNTVTLENMAINLTSATSYALKLNRSFL